MKKEQKVKFYNKNAKLRKFLKLQNVKNYRFSNKNKKKWKTRIILKKEKFQNEENIEYLLKIWISY